jgi:hypothetical protein
LLISDRNSNTPQHRGGGGFHQHRQRGGNSNFQPYRRNNNRNWNQGGSHNNQRKSFGNKETINVESYFHSSFFEDPWKDLIKTQQAEPTNEKMKKSKDQKDEEQQRTSDSN